MRKTLLAAALIGSCGIAAFSQQTPPSTTPTPTSTDTDVVKISTNLIQVDVTVTDRKGKPLPDLKPDEIEIYENGKKQKLTNFSFVSSAQLVRQKSDVKSKDAGPELPPQPVRPENVHRTIAIVVDDLTMSFESVWRTRDSIKKFVREQMQEGDLVAILRSGTGIGALQQFTTDKRMLLAAADKISFNMSGSARIGIFNPIAATFDEEINGTHSMTGGTRNRSSAIATQDKLDADANELRESVFVSGTLGAINYVIRGMQDLPGRKSITLISDGIPIFSQGAGGSVLGSQTLDMLRRVGDLANRASVVIYAIDARGLVVTGLTAEDDVSGLTANALESRISDRRNELFDTQDGLRFLAKATGGFAVLNQNAINRGLQRIIDDQSYYLIGFEPDDDTFDPQKHRYNKLEVKVLRKDANVRYRSGFYGIADERVAQLRRTTSSPLQSLYDALTSPFGVNDIPLRLNALFMPDARRSSFLRSFLHVDARGLTFVKDEAGKYKTTFDLVNYTFGDNGVALDGQRGTISVTLSDEGYRLMQERGFVYDFAFAIKKAGAYQVRVAIRDTATNKTGSAFQFIEVPNLKKDRIAFSGVMLGNIALRDVDKLQTLSPEAALKLINPVSNTAIRQFAPGSLLTYETTIYNAKTGTGGADLTIQTKVFNERQLVFEGRPTSIGQLIQPGGEIPWQGSLELGKGLGPGNYTLQLIVTDNNANGSHKVAVQFVPFEIIQ